MPGDAGLGKRLLCLAEKINHSDLPASSAIKAAGQELLFSKPATLRHQKNPYPECDLYVEDEAAKTMLSEILAAYGKNHFHRCQIIPYGAASVGYALGQMVNKFPRPTSVFVDGDINTKRRLHPLTGQ